MTKCRNYTFYRVRTGRVKMKSYKDNQWKYEPPKINQGKETIDEMSLIVGMYDNYMVTKTGYLVAIIEVSGVNLDLLTPYEQEDIFESYNTWLISSVGGQVSEQHQYIELTIPVNLHEYIMALKKKFIEEKRAKQPNKYKQQLIASYIEYYTNLEQRKNMTTKKHLLIVRTKIRNRSFDELQQSKKILDEKCENLVRNIESIFSHSDLRANVLMANEVTSVLKTLINFKS